MLRPRSLTLFGLRTGARIALLAGTTLVLAAGCGKGPPDADNAGASAGAPAAGPVVLLDAGPPGDPEAGAVVFAGTCVACHQKDGTGMNGMLAADFNDPARLAKPDSVLLNSIAEGIKGKTAVMPAHKEVLTLQQRKDALAYIRATFGK